MKLSAIISGLSGLLLAGAAFGSVADDLRKFEGLRLNAYRDTQGLWTCGYGHRCAEGTEMTLLTAEKALADDILRAERGAKEVFPTFSAQPQHVQDVLVEAAFQLGQAGISKFTKFIKSINKRDYADAAAEMLNSKWAKQCPTRVRVLADRISNSSLQ